MLLTRNYLTNSLLPQTFIKGRVLDARRPFTAHKAQLTALQTTTVAPATNFKLTTSSLNCSADHNRCSCNQLQAHNKLTYLLCRPQSLLLQPSSQQAHLTALQTPTVAPATNFKLTTAHLTAPQTITVAPATTNFKLT